MKSAATTESGAIRRLKELLDRSRRSGKSGVYSVCSAHPSVIEAAFRHAIADQAIFCVESTSSQVNQEGGYTGQTPREFSVFIHSAANNAGFPRKMRLCDYSRPRRQVVASPPRKPIPSAGI
jgi:D-tagatose-1,6-bisphosphate aldolase subunit GatZ/KbaZ